MPNQDTPDFSFLNDSPHTPSHKDSAILTPEETAASETPAPETAETADEIAAFGEEAAEEPVEKIAEEVAEETSSAAAGAQSAANPPEPEEKQAAQPAWMDQAHAAPETPQDSSTRFAALWGSEPPASPAPAGFSFEEQTEANGTSAEAIPETEETLVDETLQQAGAALTELTAAAAEALSSPEAEQTEAFAPNRSAASPEISDTGETTKSAADSPATEQESPPLESPTLLPAAAAAVAAAVTTPPAAKTPATKTKETSSSKSSAKASKTDPTEAEKSQNLKFMILLSYASAVTLFCLYLLFQSMAGKPHDLESLPDLKPPMKKDEIAYRLVPEAASLPAGHTLKLGQSQRFGNLRVTPVRVEQTPLQFVHYSGDPSRKRPDSAPVLKLWLKFENVSQDQKFAPIDRQLMLTRVIDPKNPALLRSNQCLSPARSKGDPDKTSLLFDLELNGDWNFAGIDDDPLLGPGETLEIYLPSAEVDSLDLTKPLLWRIHFRKGYHPQSYRGVTTLIEVQVDPTAIQTSANS